jgi:thymidylate kinase
MSEEGSAPGMETAANESAVSVHRGLLEAFRALDMSWPRWALVRGEDDLEVPRGDVDLLVAGASSSRLRSVLDAVGFRHLPAAGRGSHRFYFRYETAEDLWLKLDLVDSFEFGEHQELSTSWARRCLQRRVRVEPLNQLRPDDRGWLLVLHLLLDKGHISENRRDEVVRAAVQAGADGPVPTFLSRLTGDPSLPVRLLDALRGSHFDAAEELGRQIRRRWESRYPGRVVLLRLARRFARRVSGVTLASWGPGRVVAILGPDGAGKTTLAASVCDDLPATTRYVYMGLWRESRWDAPLRGIPGGPTGLLVSRAISAGLRVRYHRFRGRIVVVDRFSYDVLASQPATIGDRVVAAVALRVAPEPDELLLLDAPGEVMFARKHEHSVELLEARRQSYLGLRTRFPAMVVLDATRSADHVRRMALDALWNQGRTGRTANPGRHDTDG